MSQIAFRRAGCFALVCCALLGAAERAPAADAVLKISSKPLHTGRIKPMLFGNFIELLDDLCPGMWAEMLNDRGFEGVIPAAKWVYYDGSPNFCDRTWDKSINWTVEKVGAFNGPCCARINGKANQVTRLSQSGLSVKQGGRYRFSAWLRSDAPDLIVQAALTAVAGLRVIELDTADLPTPTSEWKRFTADFSTRVNSDRIIFELRVLNAGTLWVDKVSLMPLESVEGEYNGWRQDVVGAIAASHPAVIRWGGSAVDPGRYRWKNGIGDRDHRVPFENLNWGRIDSNDVGIDEFCLFCRRVGAEPLVCVSFSDGAESAADLVEYCNGPASSKWGGRRVANGYASPHRVKYWQLGNEISGDDDAYVKKCKDFIRVMKRADPSIAIISSFPSQKVLDALGKDLAYLAPHHYTRDLAACEADFQKLSAMIAHTPGCGHLRIAVTEWNFTGGDWGLMRGKMLTLDGALLNARYLNLLCRNSNIVDIACRSNMTNSFCSGIIETNGAHVLNRPSYYVMQLYADHALPVPVTVVKAPDGLDVVACTDEKRGHLCIFAVNSKPEPVELSLELEGFAAKPLPRSMWTVCDTRDMRQPDVMNHWSAQNRVQTVIRGLSAHAPLKLPALSVSAITCRP